MEVIIDIVCNDDMADGFHGWYLMGLFRISDDSKVKI